MSKYKNACSSADIQKVMLPLFDALEVVHGKWRLPVLLSLTFGKKRFKQISKDVNGISDKVLAKELKLLEDNHLISRTVDEISPSIIEYEITDHGKSLEKVMIELKNWGELHRKKIIG